MARKAPELEGNDLSGPKNYQGDKTYNPQVIVLEQTWAVSNRSKGLRVALVYADPALHEILRIVFWTMRASWQLDSYYSQIHEWEKLAETAPDIVLVQEEGCTIESLNRTRQLKEALPCVPLLVLSPHQERMAIFSSLAAGASGHLVTPIEPTAIPGAIEKVIAGTTALCPRAERVVTAYLGLHNSQPAAPVHAPWGQTLTPREQEVLACIEQGLQSKEIAARLGIESRTVNAHKVRIFGKLNAHSSLDAVRKYRVWRQANAAR